MLSRFSPVQLFVTLLTVAHQAPLSMGFLRQKYWSGLPCPPPGDLLNLGIELTTFTSPALAGGFFTTITTFSKPKTQLITLYTRLHPFSTITPSSVSYMYVISFGQSYFDFIEKVEMKTVTHRHFSKLAKFINIQNLPQLCVFFIVQLI